MQSVTSLANSIVRKIHWSWYKSKILCQNGPEICRLPLNHCFFSPLEGPEILRWLTRSPLPGTPGPAPGPPKTFPKPLQNLLQPLQTSLEAPQTLLEPSNSVQETPGRPPDLDFPGFWRSTWGHVGTQHEQNAVSVLKTPICI